MSLLICDTNLQRRTTHHLTAVILLHDIYSAGLLRLNGKW
jgi:hypothetical protein